ncbi:MAG: ParB N-terminal domain-containing protein [Verrucomicrobia subdivision 3 bacterium]|nr:ParB N-terminal domain-containing protein [Limisphaerales bacterium]
MKDEVKMIPIERIRILNPRHRDRKKFEVIVQSIKNLGLKKPIQVSLRSEQEADEPGYDLVCGQGRVEAFITLGHKEIPAVIVEISKQERLLRSLIENMARRYPAPLALMQEIERLKTQGYSNAEIGKKLDIDNAIVAGLITLKNAGEERLLDAATSGRIPLGVAMDISKANSVETQRELLKAYESKQLNLLSIRTVKRLIDQRRFAGKRRDTNNRAGRKRLTSAESLVNAYRRESQKQKLMIRKAKVCDAKLVFIVTAFSKLIADENFVNLLRAESLSSMPKYLWAKLGTKHKEVV